MSDDARLFKRILAIAILSGAVLVVLICLSSCSPVKRINRIAANHPGALAGPCAQFYPVRVIDSTRVEIINGEPVYTYDTVTVDCDSVLFYNSIEHGFRSAAQNQINKHNRVRVPCPPSSHRTDTIITERYRQVENTARVSALEQERDKYKASTSRLQGGRNTWRWLALALLAYSALRVVLRLYLKISLP